MPRVKLAGFHLAKKLKIGELLDDVAGTPYYMGPGVINGKYGKSCDMWSLGVTLYVCMSGYMPFQGNNMDDVFNKIKNK